MKVLTAIISASFLFGMPALAEPFNGPVLGLSLGQSRGSVDFNFNGTVNGSPNKETGDIPMSLDGGEFGVYAGYRHAFDGGFVLGVELGYINGEAKSSSRISVEDLDFGISIEKNSQLYFDFKPGFANGEGMMIYGLIGYQRTGFDGMYTDNTTDTAKVVKASKSSSDLRIGFGVEYALSENVTVRGQYHQSSFGDLGFDFVKPKTNNGNMEDFIEKYDARESVVSIGITFGF
ncbi:MAG: outer membrane beta-barrel protein [Roseovarius sp.]|nr:outer membrane beta-barrel protein [Roseovarius sp.]